MDLCVESECLDIWIGANGKSLVLIFNIDIYEAFDSKKYDKSWKAVL